MSSKTRCNSRHLSRFGRYSTWNSRITTTRLHSVSTSTSFKLWIHSTCWIELLTWAVGTWASLVDQLNPTAYHIQINYFTTSSFYNCSIVNSRGSVCFQMIQLKHLIRHLIVWAGRDGCGWRGFLQPAGAWAGELGDWRQTRCRNGIIFAPFLWLTHPSHPTLIFASTNGSLDMKDSCALRPPEELCT